MSDLFTAQKSFSGYLPQQTGKMISAEDYSYYYADSSNVYGPEKKNGDKINNIPYRSDQIQNYRFGVDLVNIFNDLWDVNPYNNKINFLFGITTTPVTLTNGRYKMKAPASDPLSFSAMFNTRLSVAGLIGWSVDVANGVLTLTSAVPNFFVLYPDATMEKYATRLHGIRTGAYTTSINSFTPYFSYTDIIYFRSDINKYSKFDESGADGKSNIIQSIILERDLYSKDTDKQTYEPMMIKYFKVNEQMSPGNFQIALYDELDNPLYIQPESNFKYILRFMIKNYPN